MGWPVCRPDAGPSWVGAKRCHCVLKRFQWSLGLDEDVHLAGAEVVAVYYAVCSREMGFKQILHRDERIKVGHRGSWPLQNEDVLGTPTSLDIAPPRVFAICWSLSLLESRLIGDRRSIADLPQSRPIRDPLPAARRWCRLAFRSGLKCLGQLLSAGAGARMSAVPMLITVVSLQVPA